MENSTLPLWAQFLGIGATALAAIMGAVAAIAAWRSAKYSQATSHDALEALALGIKPQLVFAPTLYHEGGKDSQYFLMVRNPSEWDATDIDVEVLLRNGKTIHSHTERLPALHGKQAEPGKFMRADLGIPLEQHEEVQKLIGSIVIRYSDYRSIARYEQGIDYSYEEKPGGITTSGQAPRPQNRIK